MSLPIRPFRCVLVPLSMAVQDWDFDQRCDFPRHVVCDLQPASQNNLFQSYTYLHLGGMAVVLIKFDSGHRHRTNDTNRQRPQRRRLGCLHSYQHTSPQPLARLQALKPPYQPHRQIPASDVPRILLACLLLR